MMGLLMGLSLYLITIPFSGEQDNHVCDSEHRYSLSKNSLIRFMMCNMFPYIASICRCTEK